MYRRTLNSNNKYPSARLTFVGEIPARRIDANPSCVTLWLVNRNARILRGDYCLTIYALKKQESVSPSLGSYEYDICFSFVTPRVKELLFNNCLITKTSTISASPVASFSLVKGCISKLRTGGARDAPPRYVHWKNNVMEMLIGKKKKSSSQIRWEVLGRNRPAVGNFDHFGQYFHDFGRFSVAKRRNRLWFSSVTSGKASFFSIQEGSLKTRIRFFFYYRLVHAKDPKICQQQMPSAIHTQ